MREGNPKERGSRILLRIIKKEVRGSPECKTVSVTEAAPDGSTRTVTRRKCD